MVSTGMGRENMGSTKKVLYKGKHPDLVNGKSYGYEDYARVAGVGYKSLYSRLYGKNVVTDVDLRPIRTPVNIGKSKPKWDGNDLSQKWLSRSL